MQPFQRIRDLREDLDMTQGEIAQKLYLQREVYRRYEVGERDIPISIMILIANFHNVSIDYLVGRTDKKEVNR